MISKPNTAPSGPCLSSDRVLRAVLAVACLALASTRLLADQSSSGAKTPPADSETHDESSVVQLSPFQINESKSDGGYSSTQTSWGRLASNLMETPGSYVVINRQLMDDLNASALQPLLALGVSGVSTRQGDGFDDMTFRGFRTANQLRNGVLKRSFKANEVYDVERVEVIKGPGGMLIGNNAIQGGAVNYVTRKPTATPEGYVNLTAGNKSLLRMEANTSGPLYKEKDFSAGYRFTVGGMRGGRDKDIETVDQKFVGAAVGIKLSPTASLSFTGSWYVNNDYIYYNDFLDISKLPTPVLHPRTLTVSPSLEGISYNRGVEKALDMEFLSKITEHTDVRFFYNFYDYLNPQSLVYGNAVLPDNHTITRNGIYYPVGIASTNHTLQLDLVHQLSFSKVDNKFMLGAETTFEKLVQNPIVYSSTPAIANYSNLDLDNPNYSGDAAVFALARPLTGALLQRFNTTSWYLQDNITLLGGKLIFVGGLRWIHPDRTDINFITNVTTDAGVKTTQTHKYGVVYRPVDWFSAYYTNAENVTIRSGFLNNPGVVPPVPLKDSFFQMDEVGVKVNFNTTKNTSLYATMAYFDMTLTNVPTNVTINNVLMQIQTAGTHSKGVESDIGAKFRTGAGDWDFIITYYKVKLRDAVTGLKTNEAPESSYTALVKYTATAGPLNGFMIGAGWREEGSKRSGGFEIDAPSVYTAFAGYRWNDHWSSQLNVENLTDQRYFTVIGTTAQAMVSASRSIRFSTKYKW